MPRGRYFLPILAYVPVLVYMALIPPGMKRTPVTPGRVRGLAAAAEQLIGPFPDQAPVRDTEKVGCLILQNSKITRLNLRK